MFYAVINRVPDEFVSEIDNFRKIYDRSYGSIPSHTTLVFPIKTDEISRNEIIKHIEGSIKNTPSFDMEIGRTELSFDKFLFLVPKDKQSVIDLHDRLYQGILSQYLREDIEFIPHITIGQFTKQSYDLGSPREVNLDEESYDQALRSLEKINYRIRYRFNNIELITVDDNFKNIEYIKKFELGEENEV